MLMIKMALETLFFYGLNFFIHSFDPTNYKNINYEI